MIFLDGSYITAKDIPGDYDACWEPDGIDFSKLDPVFGEFDNNRERQKAKFGGEFFPSTFVEAGAGRTFVEFFQNDRFTGKRKGIVSILIIDDELVARRMKS